MEAAGVSHKDMDSMQDAITQVNGTTLCYEHAKPYFEKMREEKNQSDALIKLIDSLK
jgi:hypothetical protein